MIQYYYQNTFSLENPQKINKLFKQFDTIDESIDALKEIISEKKNIILKKEENKLFIIFKFKKIGKGEEEFSLMLNKNNEENDKIIDNLISNINELKSKIENLKNEIKKKFKKYSPTLENGWITIPFIPQKFIVCKNNYGKVSIQGVVYGDLSKKIFTLEKEFRTK